MPTKIIFNRTFDARPDRFDFRDLLYRPRLISLPEQYPSPKDIATYFPTFRAANLILDQGDEGACTGFGLAAVVNYLRWESRLNQDDSSLSPQALESVSASMLYRNARLYDEWRGEDYEGSSCRGAMKGLHKHGVCRETKWPYVDRKPGRAQPGWDADAAQTPLGAYFRINGKSLVDMQSAILETHAIYVSADVHDGWDRVGKKKSFKAAVIPGPTKNSETGGHAFAIVGYTPDGFIVQNSWGPDWGYEGFALLHYEDWTQNGTDAWALALGAPMRIGALATDGKTSARQGYISPSARSEVSLDERLRSHSVMRAKVEADASAVSPWINGEEFGHTIFIGHNGRAEREIVPANDGDDAVRVVIQEGMKRAASDGFKHVAIYVHGGLNDREAGVKRAQILGPWFKANGIHPIFVVWQTGFLESAGDILKGAAEQLFLPSDAVSGWLMEKINKVKDRAFEVFARDAGVRAIWENMKLRAAGSVDRRGGLTTAAKCLSDSFKGQADAPQLHLLGHSAGAIMHGHFLSAMEANGLSAASMHLWAPACTVAFATEKYGKAFAKGVADPSKTFVTVLSDVNERDDPCVPVLYSKSLLYLVSRALEAEHKTPILGMTKVWERPINNDADVFMDGYDQQVQAWEDVSKKVQFDKPIVTPDVLTLRERNKIETIDANHGSFDNNIEVVNTAFERILGRKPKVPVTDLRGF